MFRSVCFFPKSSMSYLLLVLPLLLNMILVLYKEQLIVKKMRHLHWKEKEFYFCFRNDNTIDMPVQMGGTL